MRLALRDRVVEPAAGQPLLMGIVNASPDSFSEIVAPPGPEALVERGVALVADGAAIIDVGGESGVTHTPLSEPDTEISRVVPVVEGLATQGVTVSVDTFKPEVARAALEAGAAMVNDVSGLADPELARLCARTGAALVLMHTRAEPKQERFPDYDDVVGDVERFLAERVAVARGEGLAEDQIVLDPGPDFAKRPEETVAVLRAWERLAGLGRPLLAAVSRKYFLGAITGRPPDDRQAATLAAVLWAADAGAAIVRVHDVRAAADALAVHAVLRGDAEVPAFDAGDESLKWVRPGE